MYLRRSEADVIRQGQSAAPIPRSHGPAERLQQWLRVCVRDREDRNLCDGLRIFTTQTLRIRSCADSRSERITGIAHEVHHATALHAIGRTHRTFRKHRLFEISVVVRIRIDEASDGAVLICDFGLYPAP